MSSLGEEVEIALPDFVTCHRDSLKEISQITIVSSPAGTPKRGGPGSMRYGHEDSVSDREYPSNRGPVAMTWGWPLSCHSRFMS